MSIQGRMPDRRLRSAHEAVDGIFDPIAATQLGDASVVIDAQLLIAGMSAADLSAAVELATQAARVRSTMALDKERYSALHKFQLERCGETLSQEKLDLVNALRGVDHIEFSALSAMGLLQLFEATCRVVGISRDSVEFMQLEESLLWPRLKAREISAAAVRQERAERAAAEKRVPASAVGAAETSWFPEISELAADVDEHVVARRKASARIGWPKRLSVTAAAVLLPCAAVWLTCSGLGAWVRKDAAQTVSSRVSHAEERLQVLRSKLESEPPLLPYVGPAHAGGVGVDRAVGQDGCGDDCPTPVAEVKASALKLTQPDESEAVLTIQSPRSKGK